MNDKRPQTLQKDRKFLDYDPDKAYTGLAMFLIAGALIIFFTVLKLQPATRDANHHLLIPDKATELKDYWAVKGTVGDFTAGVIGTIFSLAAFSMIYLSFKKQRESNETQLKMFEHDKVESRFFELVKTHRENVGELSFSFFKGKGSGFENHITNVTEEIVYEKRQYFLAVLNQFKQLNKELDDFFQFNVEEIYVPAYLQRIKQNETITNRKIDLLLLARLDIVYLFVFFGVGREGKSTIHSLIKDRYDENIIDYLLYLAALKPERRSSHYRAWYHMQKRENKIQVMNELIKFHAGLPTDDKVFTAGFLQDSNNYYLVDTPKYKNDYIKYYGGHQFRLGHYFRHLFQTVCFINDNDSLDAKKQYSYIRHLRGQLSTAEQILIFLNSLSQLGRAWELEDKKTGSAIDSWNHLISDYMLIKNIPSNEVIGNVFLTDFYPDIKFEAFN